MEQASESRAVGGEIERFAVMRLRGQTRKHAGSQVEIKRILSVSGGDACGWWDVASVVVVVKIARKQ